jgi:hypothetical protein
MKIQKLFEELERRKEFKNEPGFDRLGYASDPVGFIKIAPKQLKKLEEYLAYYKSRKEQYTYNPEFLSDWGWTKGDQNSWRASDIIHKTEEAIADLKDSIGIAQAKIDKGANQKRLLTLPTRRF